MIRHACLYVLLLVVLLALTCCTSPGYGRLQPVGSQVEVELPDEPDYRITLGFHGAGLLIPLGTSLDRWFTSAGVKEFLPELGSVQGKTRLERIQSILGILNKKIIYIPDEDSRYKTPIQTLREGGGDCEDLAILAGIAIRMDNYEGRIYIGFGLKHSLDGQAFGHAWCMLPDEESIVDCFRPPTLRLLIGATEWVVETLNYTLLQTYAIP